MPMKEEIIRLRALSKEAAAAQMTAAIAAIDAALGEGYAKNNPQLIAAHMSVAASVAGSCALLERNDTIKDWLTARALRARNQDPQVKIEAAKAILKKVQDGSLVGEFTLRELVRRSWSGLQDYETAIAGVNHLVELGYITRLPKKSSGGRPKEIFVVSPTALQAAMN